MTLVHVETGEVVSEDEYLESLASRIRAEQRRGRDALDEAYDAALSIGACLNAARRALASDEAYGSWFRGQDFGFTTEWGRQLRFAAEHEIEVRAEVESQLSRGKTSVNFDKAIKQVRAALGGGRDNRSDLAVIEGGDEVVPDVFPVIVIDPPWQYGNRATRGAAEDHYPTMSFAELEDLELPAADNAHLYLWVTNAFVSQGFDLLVSWGFTYKTMLTWCKPSIGMGNYFRNNTEHVLFGVRGSLPTARNDIGTWFEAKKGRHSAKPESFYDLVESCSPGPWLEMFARRRRMGWHVWGNEA